MATRKNPSGLRGRCTSILDSLDGTAPHAAQRISFVVVAKSPIQRIRAFAHERDWRNVRLLSSANNTYNRDYHGESADGSQRPDGSANLTTGNPIIWNFDHAAG